MSKEEFKAFVKKKPALATYVKNNKVTWQSLYEIFELYGANNVIWDDYLKNNNNNKLTSSFNEIVNTIKSIDLDRLQNGIESIQNTISLIQNFGNSSTKNNTNYEPRYHYHHMDD